MNRRPVRRRRPPWRRETLACAAVFVMAGVFVYWHGFNAPFIFDDRTAVLANTQIRQLWPLSDALAPPRDTPVAGRPLVNLSLAVNYGMGGLDVRPYRVTNLAIHLLATLALFGVLRRSLALVPLEPLQTHARPLAFVIALLWMLHPLPSEVVNYVTQRTTSLAALMLLITLYASIRALAPGGARRRWEAGAVLSCAAGMACKESMVVAPVLVVLLDRVLVFATFRAAFSARRRLYTGLAATWVVLGLLLWGVPRTTVGFDAGVSAWTYLLNQAAMIVHYLRLVVWPQGLVLDYGLPRMLTLRDVLVPVAFVSGLVIATAVALIRRPLLGFLGAWFFITLAPTSSIVPIVTEVGAERRMYLPLAAVMTLMVCSAFLLGRTLRLRRPVAVLTCVVVCALLATGSVARTREYRSRLTMAQTVVDRWPHGRAYLRLGGLLMEEGRRPEALEYFQRARAANTMGSRFALGTEHLVDGDLERGIAELRDFVRLYPRHVNTVPALEMLGQAYLSRGRLDSAAETYEAILDLAPEHPVAHDALGSLRLEQNRPQEAAAHLARVTAARPGDANAWGRLGTALTLTGRVDDGITAFTRAVEGDPQDARARRMLGQTLAARGRLQDALVQFRRAVELAPDDEQARQYLEKATRQLNRMPSPAF